MNRPRAMYPRLGISCSKDGRDMMWKTYYWGGVGVFKLGTQDTQS